MNSDSHNIGILPVRSRFVSVSIFLVLMLSTVISIAADEPFPSQPRRTIIKSEAEALNFKAPSEGEFYIQAGAFSSVKNSRNYQRSLAKKVHYSVRVEEKRPYHVVLIGPVHSAAEIRSLGATVYGSSSELALLK